MKPTIIAIVGASGSGKTYFSRLLQNELNVFAIVSYTTRPKRTNETAGKDYYFIGKNQAIPFCEMLTHTKFGGYEYFALRDQVPPEGYCSYVVDENGVQALKRMHGERYRVVTVLVRSGALIRNGFFVTGPADNCRTLFMTLLSTMTAL